MAKPSTPIPPRVDLEPIYTQLKASIGDNWPLYKTSVSEFVMGKRNQAELDWIIGPFMNGQVQRQALHNQLIVALFANAHRDPPEQAGVASWVAANDKPTAAVKPVTGDAAEQKLKSEIMHLPPRERHRVKNLAEVCHATFIDASANATQEPTDVYVENLSNQTSVLKIKLPDAQAPTAGGYTRTSVSSPILTLSFADIIRLGA